MRWKTPFKLEYETVRRWCASWYHVSWLTRCKLQERGLLRYFDRAKYRQISPAPLVGTTVRYVSKPETASTTSYDLVSFVFPSVGSDATNLFSNGLRLWVVGAYKTDSETNLCVSFVFCLAAARHLMHRIIIVDLGPRCTKLRLFQTAVENTQHLLASWQTTAAYSRQYGSYNTA